MCRQQFITNIKSRHAEEKRLGLRKMDFASDSEDDVFDEDRDHDHDHDHDHGGTLVFGNEDHYHDSRNGGDTLVSQGVPAVQHTDSVAHTATTTALMAGNAPVANNTIHADNNRSPPRNLESGSQGNHTGDEGAEFPTPRAQIDSLQTRPVAGTDILSKDTTSVDVCPEVRRTYTYMTCSLPS